MEYAHTFVTPYSQHADRSGHACAVIEAQNSVTHPEDYDEEVGTLYLIELADGERIVAWPEELDA